MRAWLLVSISVVLAILLGQVPEFAQQYAQRLGGAIDELDRTVRHFDEDPRRSGYDRSGALALNFQRHGHQQGPTEKPVCLEQDQRRHGQQLLERFPVSVNRGDSH
jgi:hypothetical protein